MRLIWRYEVDHLDLLVFNVWRPWPPKQNAKKKSRTLVDVPHSSQSTFYIQHHTTE